MGSLEMLGMATMARLVLLVILVSTSSLSAAAPPPSSDTSPDYLLGEELGDKMSLPYQQIMKRALTGSNAWGKRSLLMPSTSSVPLGQPYEGFTENRRFIRSFKSKKMRPLRLGKRRPLRLGKRAAQKCMKSRNGMWTKVFCCVFECL